MLYLDTNILVYALVNQDQQKMLASQAKLAMAAKLFEMKRLSSGQAAELIGMGRVEFLLALNRLGTPAINLSEEELVSDLANA